MFVQHTLYYVTYIAKPSSQIVAKNKKTSNIYHLDSEQGEKCIKYLNNFNDIFFLLNF